MEGVELAGIAHFDRDPKYISDALNLPWLEKYPKTVEEMADRFGCPAYETIDELFEKGKPDALAICTEDYLRSKYCAIGLEHGMHVFLPKPFAQTTEEALAAFEMSNHLGLVTVGSLPTRFRSPSVTAQEIVASGAIGRPPQRSLLDDTPPNTGWMEERYLHGGRSGTRDRLLHIRSGAHADGREPQRYSRVWGKS